MQLHSGRTFLRRTLRPLPIFAWEGHLALYPFVWPSSVSLNLCIIYSLSRARGKQTCVPGCKKLCQLCEITGQGRVALSPSR